MVARHFRRPSALIGRVEGGTYDSIKVAEVGLAETDHGNMAETSVLVALLWMRSYVVERGNEGGDGNENDEVDVVVESGGREDGTGKIKEVVRVGTALSSNDRFSAFNDAHQNAVNRMLKVRFISYHI